MPFARRSTRRAAPSREGRSPSSESAPRSSAPRRQRVGGGWKIGGRFGGIGHGQTWLFGGGAGGFGWFGFGGFGVGFGFGPGAGGQPGIVSPGIVGQADGLGAGPFGHWPLAGRPPLAQTAAQVFVTESIT